MRSPSGEEVPASQDAPSRPARRSGIPARAIAVIIVTGAAVVIAVI